MRFVRLKRNRHGGSIESIAVAIQVPKLHLNNGIIEISNEEHNNIDTGGEGILCIFDEIISKIQKNSNILCPLIVWGKK